MNRSKPCPLKPLWILPLFVSHFVGIAGCTSKKVPTHPNQVTIQIDREPLTLDPSQIDDGIALHVGHNIWDGLIGYDAKGNLEPRLARNWRVSSDTKRFEFTLRKTAKWSDGRSVRAEDFVFAIRRALSPQTVSKHAPLLYAIRGAKEFQEGSISDADLGVYAAGHRVIIETTVPAPYLLHALTLPVAFPLRSDSLKSEANSNSVSKQDWIETSAVTGPYYVHEHRKDQFYHLKKNPHYWGDDPAIADVRIQIVADETTATHLFEQGQVDILTRISTLDYQRLKEKGLIRLDPFLATYYLAFNCKKSPFDQVSVRRKVSLAVDKEKVVQALAIPVAPASSWIPLGLEGHYEFKDQVESVSDKERKEFSSLSPVEFAFDQNIRNQRVFEVLQQSILENLGLKVHLNTYDWKSYYGVLKSDPPPAFRMGWLASIHDPIPHLRAFLSDDPNNVTGCKSAKYDQMVRKIETMTPGKEREELIERAQKILLEEVVALVPIYHYIQVTAVSDRLSGVHISPFGTVRAKDLTLKSAKKGSQNEP